MSKRRITTGIRVATSKFRASKINTRVKLSVGFANKVKVLSTV